MAKIKESSTIQENKRMAHQECPVTYVMDKIGGYWKPIILFQLLSGEKRYGELKKAIPHITEKMLIQNLKQLERDKIINREAKPVIPPHVTYSFTDTGKALRSVLVSMAEWAILDSRENDLPFFKNIGELPGK